MKSIVDQKSQLREYLKQRRMAIDQATRDIYDQQILSKLLSLEEVHDATSFFCFISFGSEIHTHGLINTLLTANKRVAVPKIPKNSEMLAVPFHAWNELQTGSLGILTPPSSLPAEFAIDVSITPGLGFSARGDRLGYGRGYYDRWFHKNPTQHKIAIAYECQILPEIPVDDTDVRVDMIVTEERVILTAEVSSGPG